MELVDIYSLESDTFYKTVGTPLGFGIFYITKTRAVHYKGVYSYTLDHFKSMFSNSQFYPISFREVLMALLDQNAVDENSWNGKKIREIVGEPYEAVT